MNTGKTAWLDVPPSQTAMRTRSTGGASSERSSVRRVTVSITAGLDHRRPGSPRAEPGSGGDRARRPGCPSALGREARPRPRAGPTPASRDPSSPGGPPRCRRRHGRGNPAHAEARRPLARTVPSGRPARPPGRGSDDPPWPETARTPARRAGRPGPAPCPLAEREDSSTNSLEVCPTSRQHAFVFASESSPPQKFSVQDREAQCPVFGVPDSITLIVFSAHAFVVSQSNWPE